MTISREELLAFLDDLQKEGYVVTRLEGLKDTDMVDLLEAFNQYMDDVNTLIALRKEFLSLDISDPGPNIDIITRIESALWDPDRIDELRSLLDMLKHNLREKPHKPAGQKTMSSPEKKKKWLQTHNAVQDEMINLAKSKGLGAVPTQQDPIENTNIQRDVLADKDNAIVNTNKGAPPIEPENPTTKEGSEICRFCNGTGKCNSCNGTGKCYWCNGTGVIEKNGSKETCPYCSGSGKCYWCSGTGICSKCSGTGIVRGGN